MAAQRSGVHSLDMRLGRQLDTAVRLFRDAASLLGVDTGKVLGSVERAAFSFWKTGGTPQFLLDELRSCYAGGVECITRAVPRAHRVAIRRQWDEILVLCNLASDFNAILVRNRAGGPSRFPMQFVYAEGKPCELDAAATFELPAHGEIARAAGLPYLRNLWSRRRGFGADLVRHIRDLTRSETLLVKPLSPILREYYCKRHHGKPFARLA